METKERPTDPISYSDAREFLGVTWRKFRELRNAGYLGDYYVDPLDKRAKYLSRAKVEALKAQSIPRAEAA